MPASHLDLPDNTHHQTLDLILLLSSSLGVTLLQFVARNVINGADALKIHLLFGCVVSALLGFQTPSNYVARYIVSFFGVPVVVIILERLADLTKSLTAPPKQEAVGSNAHIYAQQVQKFSERVEVDERPPPPKETQFDSVI